VTLCGPVKLILTTLARADILGRPVHHGGRDDRGYDRPMAPDTVYDASLLQPMHLAPIRLDLVDHQRRKARTRPPRIATSVVQASGAHWSTRALASPISPIHPLTSYPGSLYAPSDASSVSGSPVSTAAPGLDSPSVYFDVLRSDPRFDGLVHIASSRSRWTAIPLLPRARVAALPADMAATAAARPLSKDQRDAAAAQERFELEVLSGAPVPPPRGHSASPSPDEDDDSEADPARKHICPRCGKRFNRPSSLRAHGRTHTGFKRTQLAGTASQAADMLHSLRVPLRGLRSWL
jgi:hypothetical protein